MAATNARTPVLIVEDEDVVADTLTRWLGGLGYDITRASSAEQAIAAMETLRPSVAICDVGLPGKDGLWFADRVHQEYATTAVVLATGRDNLPPAETMRSGVVSYLVKPFGRTELRNAVSDASSWHEDTVPRSATGARLESELDGRLEALNNRLTDLHVDRDVDVAIEMLFPDKFERARIEYVVALAAALAQIFNLSSADQDDLRLAAQLHRLWQLMFADTNDGLTPLSHAEIRARRDAPARVADRLADHYVAAGTRRILRAVRERFDGMGVPDMRVGDLIPMGSRILAVAEAVGAMTAPRSDRPARSSQQICRELGRCAGTQFDPDVAQAAMALMPDSCAEADLLQ